MNKINVICIAITGTVVAVAVKNRLDKIQTRKEIADLDARTECHVQAIYQAGEIVREKIKNGDYRNTGNIFDAVHYDLKFYTMSILEE